MILILALGLATGCAYAIVGIGYSLIYRTTGIVNFAQGTYVTLGGLITYWLYTSRGLPYPLAIALSVATTAALGILLWRAIVIPFFGRRAPSFIILLATILFAEVLADLAQLAFGTNPETLPDWIHGFRVDMLGGSIDGQYVIVLAVTLVLVVAFEIALSFSNLGRAMRACAADREVSQLLGVSPQRIGTIAFGATAAFGGLAGAMIAPAQFASYDSGITYAIFGIVAAVLGGFGSQWGALIGGLALGIIQAVIGRYLPSGYDTSFAFAALFLLLLVRPQGLLGTKWEGAAW